MEICYMCRRDEESSSYLFNDCQFFKQMIVLLFTRLNISFPSSVGSLSMKVILDNSTNKETREILAIASFIIWRERFRIFREENKTIVMLIEEVRYEWSVLRESTIV